jgi:hypothetical protein
MAMLSRLGGISASAIKVVETTRSTGFTLSRADRGRRIICTSVFTIVVPAATALGTDFSCEVIGAASLAEDDRVTISLPSDTAFAARHRAIRVFVTNGGVGASVVDLQCLPT